MVQMNYSSLMVHLFMDHLNPTEEFRPIISSMLLYYLFCYGHHWKLPETRYNKSFYLYKSLDWLVLLLTLQRRKQSRGFWSNFLVVTWTIGGNPGHSARSPDPASVYSAMKDLGLEMDMYLIIRLISLWYCLVTFFICFLIEIGSMCFVECD